MGRTNLSKGQRTSSSLQIDHKYRRHNNNNNNNQRTKQAAPAAAANIKKRRNKKMSKHDSPDKIFWYEPKVRICSKLPKQRRLKFNPMHRTYVLDYRRFTYTKVKFQVPLAKPSRSHRGYGAIPPFNPVLPNPMKQQQSYLIGIQF